MSTSCLFLKASSDACATEIDAIAVTVKAAANDATMEIVEWGDYEKFKAQVDGKKFNLIYLGAHADGDGFGDENNMFPWQLLASAVCISDCLEAGGVLFMGCCRGGMKTIAVKIFSECGKIDHIVGPTQVTKGGDLVPAFAAFIRGLKNGATPQAAAALAGSAINASFACHERIEFEIEIDIARRVLVLEYQLGDILTNQSEILHKLDILLGPEAKPSEPEPPPKAA